MTKPDKIKCWAAVDDPMNERHECKYLYENEPTPRIFADKTLWTDRSRGWVLHGEITNIACRGLRKGQKKPVTITIEDGHGDE